VKDKPRQETDLDHRLGFDRTDVPKGQQSPHKNAEKTGSNFLNM
jgi:hypothetical protein